MRIGDADAMDDDAANRWARVYRERQTSRRAHASPRGFDPLAVTNDIVPKQGTSALSVTADNAHGVAIKDPTLATDLVVVSIPVGRATREDLARSTRSILCGSHENVVVVCVSGPDSSELECAVDDDPRVVRVRLDTMLGSYFVHDAVLRAFPRAFIAPHGSRDESRLQRLQAQLRAIFLTGSDACFSPVVHVESGRRIQAPVTVTGPTLFQRASQFGLYHGPSVMDLGGFYSGLRTGSDLLFTACVCLLGRTVVTRDPLYTVREPESFYDDDKVEAQSIYGHVWQAHQQSLLVGRQVHLKAMRARATKTSTITSGLVTSIRSSTRHRKDPPACDALVDEILRRAPRTSSVRDDDLRSMLRHVESTRPSKIACFGGGPMGFMLAAYATRCGADLQWVEDDRMALDKSRALLTRYGIDTAVRFRCAPVRRFESCGAPYYWYGCDLGQTQLQLVSVCGTADIERRGCVIHHSKSLPSGTEVWMDHPDHPATAEAIASWSDRVSVSEPARFGGLCRVVVT
jgi:hypothetical protein